MLLIIIRVMRYYSVLGNNLINNTFFSNVCSRVKLFHDLDHEKSDFNRVHTYPQQKVIVHIARSTHKPCKISQAILQVSFKM
jgi:hypothetical protein